MPDYRTMFDRDYIGSWDLQGRDVVVEISRVEPRKLKSQRGESMKPILFFSGKEKAMVCNKTNARVIAALYGTATEKWIGKRISLYPTTTVAGTETVECIRVRPEKPRGKPSEGGAWAHGDPGPDADGKIRPTDAEEAGVRG